MREEKKETSSLEGYKKLGFYPPKVELIKRDSRGHEYGTFVVTDSVNGIEVQKLDRRKVPVWRTAFLGPACWENFSAWARDCT